MKLIYRTLLLSLAAVAVVSCADKENEDFYEKEARSFEQWMQLNVDLTNPNIEKLDNGMYIEWLERAPSTNDMLEPGDYFKLNYVGRSLTGGNIFVSRYKEDAQMLGSFTYYTHYVPELYQNNNGNGLVEGQLEALKLMRLGDSVRIYLPSKLAYGSTDPSSVFGSYGYEGQTTFPSGSNKSVIIDMKIEEIIPDIVAYENELVRKYAVEKWGMAAQDTIKENLYLEILDRDATADSVLMDSTCIIYYAGYFLDGFVFDTNFQEFGWENYHDKTLSFSGLSYTPSTGDMIQAFYEAFDTGTLFYNTWARMVFTSEWGYGSDGTGGTGSTIIQPYSPLIFEFYIAPKDHTISEGQDDIVYPRP